MALRSPVENLEIVNAMRYLAVAGLVCLLYDHVLTFPTEVALIWRAPRSFAKYAFLANRYLVPIVLIAVNAGISGLSAVVMSDEVCKGILIFSSITSIVSIGIATLLVLLRVLLLWDKERHVLIILLSVWGLSFTATIVLMIATVVILGPSVRFIPGANICAATEATPVLAAVWGASIVFEISVFLATIYNAISRPRTSEMNISGTLHRDGALFFFITMVLRTINVGFGATLDPLLVSFPVFFTWAIVTLCVHRLLLHVRTAEVYLAVAEKRALALSRTTSRTTTSHRTRTSGDSDRKLSSSDDEDYEEEYEEEEEEEPSSPGIQSPMSGVFVLNGRASPFGIPLVLGGHHRHTDAMHDMASKIPVTTVDIQMFYR